MMQNEHLEKLLERYKSFPFFDHCDVTNANSLAVDGETILHKATVMKDIDGIITLLKNAADPNSTDALGETPLHQAAFHNNLEIAEILVNSGAQTTIKNQYGETAADLAKAHKSKVLFNFLNRL